MPEMTPELPFGPGSAPKRYVPGARSTPRPGLTKADFRWRRGWGERFRKFALFYLPVLLVALVVWRVASEDRWRAAAYGVVKAEVDKLLTSPELTIRRIEVIGAAPELKAEIAGLTGPLVGSSSVRLDVKRVREAIEKIGWVGKAAAHLKPDGLLQIHVTPREPSVVWRDSEGQLQVLDGEGNVIGPARQRSAHPDKPLLLGASAVSHVPEALAILEAAPVLLPRVRALVRIGARRWDLILDRDMRIMLPEADPARALSRVMALHLGEDELLDRDISVVDMRLADRPVLRMRDRAVDERERQLLSARGEGEET